MRYSVRRRGYQTERFSRCTRLPPIRRGPLDAKLRRTERAPRRVRGKGQGKAPKRDPPRHPNATVRRGIGVNVIPANRVCARVHLHVIPAPLRRAADDDTALSRIGAMTVARITTPCQVNYIHCYRCPSVPSILYGGKTGVVGSRVSGCRSPLTPGKFAVMVWKAPGVIPRRPGVSRRPGPGHRPQQIRCPCREGLLDGPVRVVIEWVHGGIWMFVWAPFIIDSLIYVPWSRPCPTG